MRPSVCAALLALALIPGAALAARGHVADACTVAGTSFDNCQYPPADGSAAKEVGTPGDDYQQGSALGDTQRGGAGNDTQIGLDGDDVMRGGAGNDTQEGGKGADNEDAGSGNDLQDGGAGADRESGHAGNDVQYGGSGNDRLEGGDGADSEYGGSGNDTIVGGRGADIIHGDAGDDTIYARDGAPDSVNCGSGRHDVAYADHSDKLRGCEKVVYPRQRQIGQRTASTQSSDFPQSERASAAGT